MPSITSDERTFFSILTEPPRPQDRRRSLRTSAGTLAVVRQIANAQPLNPVHVLIFDVSDGGLGLRCPIGLIRGGLYHIQTGHGEQEDSAQVKVVSSRRRRDGSYEIGTRYV